MLHLLEEKPFSEFTVREICREARTTTITFYAHYEDKYSLAKEIFQDLAEEAAARFLNMQENNNKDKDMSQTCCNLLDGILAVLSAVKDDYTLSLKNLDPYLFVTMSQIIIEKISDFQISTDLPVSFPYHQLSSFFCFGLWGYICDGLHQEHPIELIQCEGKRLIRAIITSSYTWG